MDFSAGAFLNRVFISLRLGDEMLEELVLATRNKGKMEEFRKLLKEYFQSVVSIADVRPGLEVRETGESFRENALIKARRVFQETGAPTLADDSGLEVEALDGRPGVHSARYAGPGARDLDNVRKLLGELNGIQRREARFVCCLALVFPDGMEVVVEGSCGGVIAGEPSGKGGFGYDPVFFLPERNMTMAELPPSEKNTISHRGRAVRALGMYLSGRKLAVGA